MRAAYSIRSESSHDDRSIGHNNSLRYLSDIIFSQHGSVNGIVDDEQNVINLAGVEKTVDCGGKGWGRASGRHD